MYSDGEKQERWEKNTHAPVTLHLRDWLFSHGIVKMGIGLFLTVKNVLLCSILLEIAWKKRIFLLFPNLFNWLRNMRIVWMFQDSKYLNSVWFRLVPNLKQFLTICASWSGFQLNLNKTFSFNPISILSLYPFNVCWKMRQNTELNEL